MKPLLPEAFFGEVVDTSNWREAPDTDVDDDELEVTPPDVIGILGFDPKEFD